MNYKKMKKKWHVKRVKYGKYDIIKLNRAWAVMSRSVAISHFYYKCDRYMSERKKVGDWHFSFPY